VTAVGLVRERAKALHETHPEESIDITARPSKAYVLSPDTTASKKPSTQKHLLSPTPTTYKGPRLGIKERKKTFPNDK
jgi:hypothetical protein